MASVASLATNTLVTLLRADTGIPAAIRALAEAGAALPTIEATQIAAANIAAELVDRSQSARYPQVYVYCEKLSNRQREKFRRFSGTAQMAVEVRISAEKSDGIERLLQLYAEAVTSVLEENRGAWQEGIYFGGEYEVTFGSVRRGGKSFVQGAKVIFGLSVSQG